MSKPAGQLHAKKQSSWAMVLLACSFSLCAPHLWAQEKHAAVSTEKAKPGDVASSAAILAAVYEVISGPAGEARNWPRFRSLFVEGARLIPIGRDPEGRIRTRVMTVEEYIERASPLFHKQGFFEQQISSVAERYGHLAHVFSTYESRHNKNDEQPFARGINSFQLMFDGNRWWIVTILWEAETPELPIPEKYLTPSSGK